jgi:hypothetical protein
MKLSKTFVDSTDFDINWEALEAKAQKEGWLKKEAAQKDVAVTEKQLDATRKEDAPTQITEKQLEPERKDVAAVTTEKQLESKRDKA